ncbi:MAG: beta-ketoacyl-ACP synthase [Symploca sp. SIO2E9]|nr:beta-ketoacyl-ACP synthase [Symploca sp. SIO2E9]
MARETQIVVTGIGLISALGNLESSWYSLLEGKSGISWYQPFAELVSKPLGLVGNVPTSLERLTKLVVSDALRDAGLSQPMTDCGVVIGSSRGSQAVWEQLARELGTREFLSREAGEKINASTRIIDSVYEKLPSLPHASISLSPFPMASLGDWLDTLPHQAALSVARQIRTSGPVLAPMAACATGIWALARGFELIQTGQCQQVLAGAVEAPITRLTLAGFGKMGALATTGCYPFDQNREGLVLGEGAAILVLESAELALRRGVPIYGQLRGFGLTCDAHRISAPDPEQRSASAAVKQCLSRSQLSTAELDYIHAHGTATKLNDYHEAQLIKKLFPQGVAVSSTKGATGHTLGASGALGAAFCLMALKHQCLPPCAGNKQPEFDLDLVRVPRQGQIRHVLCLSFGFGGQNAVMAFSSLAN